MGIEVGIGLEMIERDVMHMGQVRPRIDPVHPHQPGQRGAMLGPVLLAQTVRLGPAHLQRVHHELRHPHLDLVEKPRAGRVKRVVEVENPGFDMGKILFRHGSRIGARAARCNAKA